MQENNNIEIPYEMQEFTFHPFGEFDCDISYEIGIGDKKFDAYLSDYTNDFEQIRISIEAMLCNRHIGHMYDISGKIELCSEDSPTTIFVDFQTSRYLSTDDNISHYGDRNLVYIKITPSEFCKGIPTIEGFCERKQFIEVLYNGLLNFSDLFPIEPEHFWNLSKDIAYQKLHSPIIEDWLNEKTHPYDVQIRQAQNE